MRILENVNYPFVEKRKFGYIFSLLLLVLSLVSFVVRGFEWGIDFRGGMEFVLETNTVLNSNQVAAQLTDALGSEPEVKSYGVNALLVRTLPQDGVDINQMEDRIEQTLRQAHTEAEPRIVQRYMVGPRFAEDLQRGALYSIIGSLLVILLYVAIRWSNWRYGLSGVLTLFHDIIVILGMFSLLHGVLPFSLQLDQTLVAALLTIAGYSINDSVVIFDRMREYAGLFKTETFENRVNRSINSTLSRTVITGGTTLLTVLVLFIFGGETLRGFAFALFFGILLGTYSSIFVSAPLVIELRKWVPEKR
jgi:preprotein translocase SecF subunit